ncbi:bifunctional glutamate N-acetyltransferase/amino-acid acetyltransferase ArgJ [Aggregicoccus sp. 17bor-14]|uniref:bifunctional glutamate N-acetyltransferase/amino-acid acetyltransferase ArgJ n=1 Tax=Myxococcaceae TaxID=31 RepID=UPI00129CAACB|nr:MULTISPECIES: bifunctional glutamate N-acetyltransferase/amino-acid acetyltransferase ArgJ [Myxococcaceae]MBF5043253.1 bifunctional glutamate N-acetyltransferase/amino-acid acetyltransferase ArgJ [Simulacricoccus sp. 17bor-14]MRI89010.1 bifunctional glutamate N-acetyltransferase/amino-acid acetyltransferase ArgJ [Aggregicoccus sp. 17bor-14]
MKTPKGFTFSGLNAGIKPRRKDLGLVVSDLPCAAAGAFTVNRAKAAPVAEAEARLPCAGIRAVLVNSGNANALTGAQGLEDVQSVKSALAQELHCAPHAIVTASTGVIGVRLPVQSVVSALPQLVQQLGPEPHPAAEAIMTTDTRMKAAFRTLTLGGREVTLTAICKGSGMIAPQLATMICVVVTDCSISPTLLDRALKDTCDQTFNNLTVDNDMSTNDVVFALANGRADNAPIVDPGPDYEAFKAALHSLSVELAKEIAADGEGATKMLEVEVTGAPTLAIARDLAKSIAGSSLVKAALFGADPNWGRVLATVGARAGSQGFPVDPACATVHIQGIQVYARGPVPQDPTALRRRMRQPEVRVQVALAEGSERATSWGCDLSYDYVKINADYTSLIVQTPTGGVAKDDRLTHYSPSFKVSLLVEALSYIQRFSGKRCVIQYGGEAMVKEGLKRSFCDDINLLRSVGLQPVVVHGGGLELNRTLQRLGGRGMEGSQRISDASDLKVMEMVLTGSVNAELVTLLNREGGHAIGVSGKDGALLRARRAPASAQPGGRDVGLLGEVTQVNGGLLELLLKQDYVPVISPVGLGEDGQTYDLSADAVAAEIAAVLGAHKLLFLTDVPGVQDEAGELVTELGAAALRARLEAGGLTESLGGKARAALRALSAGVERVHVVDGRTPHSVIAELFTDRGVGTLVTGA